MEKLILSYKIELLIDYYVTEGARLFQPALAPECTPS